ncbi:hypothetical protein, partial [Neobacillus cucumis]|uniref:hypothetical protein n=1 Tax=Neobacillus cucumis TaxID=1740721 RepID=UPI001962EC40
MDRIRSLSRFLVLMGLSYGQDSFSFPLSCPHGSFMRTGFVRFSPFVSSWQLHADWIHYLPGFLVLMGLSYGQDSFS